MNESVHQAIGRMISGIPAPRSAKVSHGHSGEPLPVLIGRILAGPGLPVRTVAAVGATVPASAGRAA
jgi:hypothetical protein